MIVFSIAMSATGPTSIGLIGERCLTDKELDLYETYLDYNEIKDTSAFGLDDCCPQGYSVALLKPGLDHFVTRPGVKQYHRPGKRITWFKKYNDLKTLMLDVTSDGICVNDPGSSIDM